MNVFSKDRDRFCNQMLFTVNVVLGCDAVWTYK
jgi:hypothetical protein